MRESPFAGTMDTPLQVLIVDDYADTLELARIVLESGGYGVLVADNAAYGLALARRHHPAAILMDLYLPTMSGIEATRLLRTDPELADIPVVAHTARAIGIDDVENLFDAICAKPCLPDALLAAVKRVISARGQRAGGPPPC
jgi:CheY-like chemotaxis protein